MNNSTYLKSILILIFIIAASIGEGQPSITWQRLYPGPYDDDDLGYDICQSTDGNFYLTGGIASTQLSPRYYVIKINPLGQKIWTKEITNAPYFSYAITPTLDGGCVLTGDGARFVKLNSNGDIQINNPQSGPMRRLLDIKRTSDNFFIASGVYEYFNSLLIKFDSLGNVIWEKVYPSSLYRLLTCVEEGINGGYISIGVTKNGLSQPLFFNIIKTDTSGNLQWEKNYEGGFGGQSLVKLNDYYISCAGRGLSKIDMNGDSLEFFNIQPMDSNENVNDMKVLSNNRYVYCTFITNFSNLEKYGRIVISDSSGNIIRSKLFDYSEFTNFTSISRISENDMIIFGATYFDTIPKSNFYAIRTDSLLDIPPVGIKSSNTLTPLDFKLYQNYPNPFNSSTIIKYDLLKDDYYTLEVINTLGQVVSELMNGFQRKGTYEIYFNSSNLPSGLYFYKLKNNDNSKIKSLVFLK